MRPPQPSESIQNPSHLLENNTNNTPSQLIVGESSVEGNLGEDNLVKYREAPSSEDPPKPQR